MIYPVDIKKPLLLSEKDCKRVEIALIKELNSIEDEISENKKQAMLGKEKPIHVNRYISVLEYEAEEISKVLIGVKSVKKKIDREVVKLNEQRKNKIN